MRTPIFDPNIGLLDRMTSKEVFSKCPGFPSFLRERVKIAIHTEVFRLPLLMLMLFVNAHLQDRGGRCDWPSVVFLQPWRERDRKLSHQWVRLIPSKYKPGKPCYRVFCLYQSLIDLIPPLWFKNIKNTSLVSCSSFWLGPTYSVEECQKNSPQQMHNFLLFE